MEGWAYRAARPAYRLLQRMKHAVSGLVDPPVVVLLYHRVAELQHDPDRLAVSPENFSRQLAYLKDHFRLVRLEEDWTGLAEPAVAITFDDGYADNCHAALPLLEEIGVPATFFISTGHLGSNREFWWDRMGSILLREAVLPTSFTLADDRFGRTWPTATPAQRLALYAALNGLAQHIEAERVEDWLEQLIAWSGAKEPVPAGNRTLTLEELQALARSPWSTIGAHAVSHTALSALSAERQRYEICASKQTLEEVTGGRIDLFSYPFGNKAHYNRTTIALCREAGFARAAANFPGQVHRWTDPFQLPRRIVRDWDLETFAVNMKNWV